MPTILPNTLPEIYENVSDKQNDRAFRARRALVFRIDKSYEEALHNRKAHYVISDKLINNEPVIYPLVNEEKITENIGWWHELSDIGDIAIVVSLINSGCNENYHHQDSCAKFPKHQIDTLIHLSQEIISWHRIQPEWILGYSSAKSVYSKNYSEKMNPGPVFPWKLLSLHGIGRWYSESRMKNDLVQLQHQGKTIIDLVGLQAMLRLKGYYTPIQSNWSEEMQRDLEDYQMHYLPDDDSFFATVKTCLVLHQQLEDHYVHSRLGCIADEFNHTAHESRGTSLHGLAIVGIGGTIGTVFLLACLSKLRPVRNLASNLIDGVTRLGYAIARYTPSINDLNLREGVTTLTQRARTFSRWFTPNNQSQVASEGIELVNGNQSIVNDELDEISPPYRSPIVHF